MFSPKKILEETWAKIYLDREPDPDVFKSRIRIRSKSSGSATLTVVQSFKKLMSFMSLITHYIT
jgi:hypothetical protein